MVALVQRQDSKQARAALAKMLSKDGLAHVLDANNKLVRTIKIDEAVEYGYCYFVSVKERYLVADIDDSDGIRIGREIARRFSRYPSILVASGGHGRSHLVLHVSGSENAQNAKSEINRLWPGVDVRKDVRPPLTPHRKTGAYSELVDCQSAWDAIDRLISEPRNQQSEAAHRLKDGWDVGKRSEGLLWLAGHYVRTARSLDEFKIDVLANPKGAGAKVYEKPGRERDAYLERTFSKAEASTRHFRSQVDRWLGEFAMSQDAIGREGAKAKTVALALATIARRTGKGVIGASERELAEITCQGIASIRRAIRYLTEGGWVVKDSRGVQRGESNRYRFTYPQGHEKRYFSAHSSTVGARGCAMGLRGFLSFQTEAFSGKGGRHRVFNELRISGQLDVNEVAFRLGIQGQTVRCHLRSLLADGLVVKVGRGVYTVVDDTELALNELAHRRGTIGRTERLQQRHQIERLRYRARIEKYARLREQRSLQRATSGRSRPCQKQVSATRETAENMPRSASEASFHAMPTFGRPPAQSLVNGHPGAYLA